MRGAALLLAATLPVSVACSGEVSFRGQVLQGNEQASPFQLQDQLGNQIALSDTAGKVVVLTFLYTNCPYICPVTTTALRRAHTLLGKDASSVEFLAVSVDPQRDSVERVYEYSLEKEMLDRWHFLTGTEEQLRPIWRDYWVDPIVGEAAGEGHADSNTDGGEGNGQAFSGDDSGTASYLVGHIAPVFLIDPEGIRRVLFTELSLDPGPLVHDIRVLLKGN